MIVIREDAADLARVQQLVQSLAGEPGKHEAVSHTGGRAGEDGGHRDHGDREEHHNHSLALVLVLFKNIIKDITNIGDTLLKCLEIYPHLDINVIMLL